MDHADEELYRKHVDELIRFATTLVGPTSAEDVVAGAVVKAMTSAAWPAVTEPRAYLFRSVHNEARGVCRSDRRRIGREARTATAERFESSSISLEVRDALARLSLRQRSVLYLAYWLDLSVEEIAATLQLSRRTTERELSAARHELEVHLG
jgi:RNA polymerase sigma-70 factor (ECF subfamily)